VKAEFNYLASLIQPASSQHDDFKLNLFPEQVKGAGSIEGTGGPRQNEIHIDLGSQGKDAKVKAILKDFEGVGIKEEGSQKKTGSDLLDMMDDLDDQ